MLNSVDSVSVLTPQTSFKSKGHIRHEMHAFIDESNRLAMELLHKDRPLAEKKEALRSESLSKFKIKDIFVGKIVKRGKAAIEHIKRIFIKDEYEKWIINEVNAGRIDSDHATELLANHGIIKNLANKFLK